MAKYLVVWLALFVFSSSILHVQAQADTILVLDLATQVTSTILPVPFSATVTSGNTSSSAGSMGNVFPLSLVPPAANLFSGANFSRLAHANSFFNLADYPARTAVRLNQHYNDTSVSICSGMIVGPCFVMTSGICIANVMTKAFLSFDSIRVFPAFNNGMQQPGLPSAKVKKIYMFKHFSAGTHDVALLELDAPIGLQTGWTGIGFNSAANFSAGKVYHKFSYPSAPQPGNPTKIYNGDTLYYNYGEIVESGNYLMVGSSQAEAIPGMGGSTFLFSDNVKYYSLGLCSFSNNYLHYRIDNSAFYQLKNVLDNSACPVDVSINSHSKAGLALRLYPNPMAEDAVLEFDYNASERYRLTISNSLGQTLRTVPVTGGRVHIARQQLPAGIYVLQLRAGNSSAGACKLVIE